METLTNRGPASWAELRELLAAHDLEVEQSLQNALARSTGIGRVRALRNHVCPSVAVHDSMLRNALCPLLDMLDEGRPVADALRAGCDARTRFLARFDELSRHVAAQDVYPVSGDEIDEILAGLSASFSEHARTQTPSVAGLLEKAGAGGPGPDDVAARMVSQARLAPTRVHRHLEHHPTARGLRLVCRAMDALADFGDARQSWTDPDEEVPSPRTRLVNALEHLANEEGLSYARVLEEFDAAVEEIVSEFDPAQSPARRRLPAHHLVAAIAIHDSVVSGVLCAMLRHVPDGARTATVMRRGCEERAGLQQRLKKVSMAHGRASGHDQPFEQAIGSLIEAFREHERESTPEVAAFFDRLPESASRTRRSPFQDVMWPWHGEGPALLAIRMALWAESAPTRTHPVTIRHPSRRLLRTVYHLEDHFAGGWKESWLERWIPERSLPRPFADLPAPEPRDTGTP
jgi:hypothetical protein